MLKGRGKDIGGEIILGIGNCIVQRLRMGKYGAFKEVKGFQYNGIRYCLCFQGGVREEGGSVQR